TDPAGRDHLHAMLDLEPQAPDRAAPTDRVDHGLLVLEAEIEVARAVIVRLGNLAAHAHTREVLLQRRLHGTAGLGDGVFRQVMTAGFARRSPTFAHIPILC